MVELGPWRRQTFFAMLIARAVDDQPIVVAQAAVSAVLITAFGNQEQGWERLLDALIGVGVALVFSQLLFVPEPLRLLCRAESAVLSSLADGLQLTADALEHKNQKLADHATRDLLGLRTSWPLFTRYAQPAAGSSVTP